MQSAASGSTRTCLSLKGSKLLDGEMLNVGLCDIFEICTQKRIVLMICLHAMDHVQYKVSTDLFMCC